MTRESRGARVLRQCCAAANGAANFGAGSTATRVGSVAPAAAVERSARRGNGDVRRSVLVAGGAMAIAPAAGTVGAGER